MQNLITLIFSSKEEKKLSNAHTLYVKETRALAEKRGALIVGVATTKRKTPSGNNQYYSQFYHANEAEPLVEIWTSIDKDGIVAYGHSRTH